MVAIPLQNLYIPLHDVSPHLTYHDKPQPTSGWSVILRAISSARSAAALARRLLKLPFKVLPLHRYSNRIAIKFIDMADHPNLLTIDG
jgi:hypothetical protein